MKILFYTFYLFSLLVCTGCFSEDGQDKTALQYRVTLESPTVANIIYRQADGVMTEVQAPKEGIAP